MVQSIELLLDERTEEALRAAWDALAEAGLPTLANFGSESNRPHVTLAVTEGDGFTAAQDAVHAVFEGWGLADRGFEAVVGSIVLFGGYRHRWVLARQVVPSRPLLTLHAAVHRALAQLAPQAAVVDQTRPDAWTAHVTLARRVPADRLGEALGTIEVEPIACRFTAARLWDSVQKTVTPL